MTEAQLVALLMILIALLTVYAFIHTWRKAALPKKPPPVKAEAPRPPTYRQGPPYPPEPPYPPRSRLQPPPKTKLPKSFTNRPAVKQSQVNLKKSGYKKDAKIEEPKRRRHS